MWPLPPAGLAGTLRALETAMPTRMIRPTLLSFAAVLLLSMPTLVQAEECSYEDLQGAFTVTVDCSALQNFSGNSQEMKRIWLDGPLGEVHIMEAPEPYRKSELSVLAKTLGRQWTARRSASIRTIEFGDGAALVTTRRRVGISSRTILFKLSDRNLMARLAVVAPRKTADAALDALETAFLAGFALKEASN